MKKAIVLLSLISCLSISLCMAYIPPKTDPSLLEKYGRVNPKAGIMDASIIDEPIISDSTTDGVRTRCVTYPGSRRKICQVWVWDGSYDKTEYTTLDNGLIMINTLEYRQGSVSRRLSEEKKNEKAAANVINTSNEKILPKKEVNHEALLAAFSNF